MFVEYRIAVILAVGYMKGFSGLTILPNFLYIKRLRVLGIKCAEAGIRTPTSLRTLGPEPNASANSATSAIVTNQVIFIRTMFIFNE